MSERERALERANAMLRRLLLGVAVVFGVQATVVWNWVVSQQRSAEAERRRGESALMRAQQLIETYPPVPTEAAAELPDLAAEVR